MAYGNYPDLSSVKRILVIKLRHLGDVLLSSPVFAALKTHLPHAAIDALIYAEAAPMLQGHPAIAEILPYDRKWKKQWLQEIRFLRKIRKRSYDLVINLTEGDRGAILCKVSRAPIRVGFDPDRKGFWGKKNLYTHVVKKCPSPRHTVERDLDAIRKIGINPEERKLFFAIPKEDKERMGKILQENGIGSYILIHPTSRWRFKCYPTDKMKQVVALLVKQGKKVILTSGKDPDEMQMISEIMQEGVLNLAGKLSLKELGALIQMAECLLCVDSVSFHMANALQANVVALFGPTSDITWGPWKNPHAKVLTQNLSCRPCLQDGCGGSKISDCLQTLPVSQVLSQLKVFSEVATAGLRVVQ